LSSNKMRRQLITLVVVAVLGVADAIKCYDCTVDKTTTCDSRMCEGEYCLYVGTTINGEHGVSQGCSPLDYALLVDKTKVTANSGCLRKTIEGVEYAYEVCNTGDYCDTKCLQPVMPAQPTDKQVTCKVTSTANGMVIDDGTECKGKYCLYEANSSSLGTSSTAVCYDLDSYPMADGTKLTANSGCVETKVGGIGYSYELCNTGDYCDTHCSGSSLSLLLSLMILPMIYLLKSY
ncbi:hypothetical protein PFISCL1PPCAC_7006, partial [Pristionchus fissidentatus]